MSKAYKRAIKIVELQEELEEAKEIISKFVWPKDLTAGQTAMFKRQAARFVGCELPVEEETPEAHERAAEELKEVE